MTSGSGEIPVGDGRDCGVAEMVRWMGSGGWAGGGGGGGGRRERGTKRVVVGVPEGLAPTVVTHIRQR